MNEQKTLMELGIRAHESTLMEVSSAHPDTYPLHPQNDVLTVQVQTGRTFTCTPHRGDENTCVCPGEGGVQELVVEVERPRHHKRFLGGYRHRLTGAEFHHAAVQTQQKKKPDRGAQVFSRDTQVRQQEADGRRLRGGV